MPFHRSVKSKGSVVVMSLWSLFLLTVFALYLGVGVRQKVTLAQRLNRQPRHLQAMLERRKVFAQRMIGCGAIQPLRGCGRRKDHRRRINSGT